MTILLMCRDGAGVYAVRGLFNETAPAIEALAKRQAMADKMSRGAYWFIVKVPEVQ